MTTKSYEMEVATISFLKKQPDRVIDMEPRSGNVTCLILKSIKMLIDPRYKGTCSRERVNKAIRNNTLNQ